MLETIIALLTALGIAVGGVQGVSTAQEHQAANASSHADNAVVEAFDLPASMSLTDLLSMIADKVAAAAAHADEHAQDPLAAAGTAATGGLTTAADAVSSHGPADGAADAAANAPGGPPADAPWSIDPRAE